MKLNIFALALGMLVFLSSNLAFADDSAVTLHRKGKKAVVINSKLPAKAQSKNQAKVASQVTKTSVSAQTPTAATPTKVQEKSNVVAQARGPAGLSDSNKELEVRGQARNLSMMLVLKNKKDGIDFVKPRESYSSEIHQTSY